MESQFGRVVNAQNQHFCARARNSSSQVLALYPHGSLELSTAKKHWTSQCMGGCSDPHKVAIISAVSVMLKDAHTRSLGSRKIWRQTTTKRLRSAKWLIRNGRKFGIGDRKLSERCVFEAILSPYVSGLELGLPAMIEEKTSCFRDLLISLWPEWPTFWRLSIYFWN